MRATSIIAILAILPPALPATALETSVQYVLTLPKGANVQTATYTCDGEAGLLPVEYLNAPPNELAILPVNGEKRIFAGILSTSGVHFAAAQYEWWKDGPKASLHDRTLAADAPPILTCLEQDDIP